MTKRTVHATIYAPRMYTWPSTHHICTHDHLRTMYVHMTTYTPRMYIRPPTHHVCTHEHLHTTYTVHLLSFRTGIIKSICMKEMTLLLYSFQHTSLLTAHTDLHGHTASGCRCRSRPLQWCLMYLSWLSGCLKSSQRDAPASGISLLETKSN